MDEGGYTTSPGNNEKKRWEARRSHAVTVLKVTWCRNAPTADGDIEPTLQTKEARNDIFLLIRGQINHEIKSEVKSKHR
jgi:hypothetical protein